MTWTNRVAWQEGMFLRAQHFQQQDRHFEQFVRTRTAMLRPHPWGMMELAIDRDLLTTGRFALAAGAGVFEDGTPFVVPGETDHPAPLELSSTVRNVVVHLCVPIRQAGAVEIAPPEAPDGRYGMRGFEAYDTHSASPQPAELQVGRLRLRYMLETDDRSGWLSIGLARVSEVASDRRVTLDDRWIPPVMTCAAATPLAGLITELAGMLNQRGEALAGRLAAAPGQRGVADVSDFLLLQSVNRWHKLIAHWADGADVHPEDLYRVLLQMVGEFATFTEASKRPAIYPPYRHEDLQRSFAPVVADLRRSLASVSELTAEQIPLIERRQGVRTGAITDRSLLRAAQFVLTVQADMPTEQLRRLFPAQVKIGSTDHIRDLVINQLPGIQVRALPQAPRRLPFYAAATYFELDRGSAHWQQMQNAPGFAVHVSGDYPNLQLELWAIRE